MVVSPQDCRVSTNNLRNVPQQRRYRYQIAPASFASAPPTQFLSQMDVYVVAINKRDCGRRKEGERAQELGLLPATPIIFET